MKICVLMGSADISGGSYVIFEHCLHLQREGWDVTVVTLDPISSRTAHWHPALDALRFTDFKTVAEERFDLAIATWWKTIYEMHRIDAIRYAYFVQSIESWFYPDSDVAIRNLVNSTYLLPLPGITEARWIREHLANRFGLDFHLVPNGCSKAIYTENAPAVAPRQPSRLRVLVEGPLGVDFKNVARTVSLVRQSQADEIWLLTSSPITDYPGVDRVFSRVPAKDCPAIYRSCDVLVKLSYVEGMFGPPLEMFHCGGTAVVYDVTGHDEYIVDGENALVVTTDDESGVVAAINRLKADPALLLSLKEGARRTAAAWPDWSDVSPRFADALRRIADQPPANDRMRIRLMTEEFFRQYVRTEQTLMALRAQSAVMRLRAVVTRAGAAFARRIPPLAARLMVLRATFMEARSRPQPRTRI
jgi:glycosyltransferase involved in cell wall biosynthesis